MVNLKPVGEQMKAHWYLKPVQPGGGGRQLTPSQKSMRMVMQAGAAVVNLLEAEMVSVVWSYDGGYGGTLRQENARPMWS